MQCVYLDKFQVRQVIFEPQLEAVLTLLRTLFKRAIHFHRLMQFNPVKRVKRYDAKKQKRYLTFGTARMISL
jgi:hypothetical protein